jgi:hypothetical protein
VRFLAACDAGGLGIFVPEILLFPLGWAVFIGYVSWLSHAVKVRESFKKRGIRIRYVLLAGGAVLLTFAYFAVTSNMLIDETLVRVNCPDGMPGWWPQWVLSL